MNFFPKSILLGPITPFYSYKNGNCEKQVLIKYKNASETRKVLREIIDIFKFKSSVSIAVNIDPYNF